MKLSELLNIIKQYLIPKNKISVIIKAVDTFPISTSLLSTHSKNRRFKIKVNRIHNNEDLLVLVGEAIRFSQSSLAVVLDPAMFAEESGRQTKWQT